MDFDIKLVVCWISLFFVVFGFEFIDTARSVYDFVGACIERVAITANLYPNRIKSALNQELSPADAAGGDFFGVGMNICLHG